MANPTTSDQYSAWTTIKLKYNSSTYNWPASDGTTMTVYLRYRLVVLHVDHFWQDGYWSYLNAGCGWFLAHAYTSTAGKNIYDLKYTPYVTISSTNGAPILNAGCWNDNGNSSYAVTGSILPTGLVTSGSLTVFTISLKSLETILNLYYLDGNWGINGSAWGSSAYCGNMTVTIQPLSIRSLDASVYTSDSINLWHFFPRRYGVSYSPGSTWTFSSLPSLLIVDGGGSITLPGSQVSSNTLPTNFSITVYASVTNGACSWSSNSFSSTNGTFNARVNNWSGYSCGSSYTPSGHVTLTADWGWNDYVDQPYIDFVTPNFWANSGYSLDRNTWSDGSAPNTTKRVWSSATYYLTNSASAIKYTLYLNKNGGSGGSDYGYAVYNLTPQSIYIPSRSGYTFNGYYSGSTQYYTSSGYGARTYTVASDLTLTASWSAQSRYVTLYYNGPSGSTSIYCTMDSSLPSISIPSWAGYRFDGYYTSGGTQYYNGNGLAVRSYNDWSVTALYAHWTRLYTISRWNGSSWLYVESVTAYTNSGARTVDYTNVFAWDGSTWRPVVPGGL